MTNLSLSQDTKYFFTVTAYNNVGLYSVTTSDGFIVDIDSPVSGAVFNSNNYKNLAYQSSNNTMTVSFQGFQDDSSGVRYFMAAIANNTQLTSFIKPFANVGLTTQYTFNDLELVQGGTYYTAVKSVDNAGHWSETVVSRGIIVDTTPPIGVACRKYETINFNSTISTSKTEMSSVIHANLSRGIPYTIFGSFNVSIDMVNVRLYLESHIESIPLIQNHDNSLGIDYNFIPSSNIDSVKLSIEGLNVTEPILDLQACTNVIEDNDGAVIIRQVSSKMFAVYVPVVDQESHVNKVEIGAGTTPGGFQVQPLTTIHNAYTNSIIKGHAPHGSTLHVTVVAENRAGLRSVFYSKPLMVDLTPPVLHDVSVQQRINTTTLENATDPVIILETDWITNDDESGVKYCFCQIGSKPGLSNIQTKWKAHTDASCTSNNLYLNHGQRVYVTVRCVNEIQLFVTTSSTPVIISFQKPGVDSAEVDVVPLNQISPVYTPTLNTALSVQSNKSCIELKWSKFHDLSDIEFYEYRVTQNGETIVDWARCIKPYMTMNCNVMMGDGRYMAEVRAVNTGGYMSDSVSTQFVVASTEPKLTGHPISFTRNHQHLTMDWSNVFNTQSDVPVLFGVLVGSRPGFEDIKDIQYTSGHALNISIPESTIITPHIQELFVRVEYSSCGSWSRCSKTCGGGQQSRTCHYVYGNGYYSTESRTSTDSQGCNEICYHGHKFISGSCQCPKWRSRGCCEACIHITIPHCKPNKQECGGNPDGIRCTECDDSYYSAGYNNGCRECQRIDHCTARHCTSPTNTRCSECEGRANKVLFKVSPNRTACDRMCSHQNDYCWPGTCGFDLTNNCQCAKGFNLVSNAIQTTCQPNIPPEIETCRTVLTGPNGEKVQALSSSNSTECKNLQDMYGNFQLVQLTFDMFSSFTLPKPNDTKPRFVKEHNIGVTDTSVYIETISVMGSRSRLSSHHQLVDSSNSTSANATFASNANITINHELSDGETLCAVFESLGGGYLKTINVMSNNSVSAAIPYNKIKQTEQVCYRYDSNKPEHCKEKGSCGKEPIVAAHPITSSPIQTVYFEGWFVPVPAGGKVIQASQIESYEIRVNEVYPSSDVSTVDYTKTFFSNKMTADVNEMTLNLTSKSPRLYCITLEVTDVAKNPRQARRFILYDNTSFIKSSNDKPFIVSSASTETGFKWQTHHHDICLSWKGHFLNQYYLDNKILNPIAPEPNGLIQDVYEQFQAPLSVNGTPNVDGITSFMFSWNVDGGPMSNEIAVPEFLNQTFCKDLGVKDGEVYTIQIRPIDVVGHTYAENRTVAIDRSAPHVNNIWLTKDGYQTLFAHDSKDLSKLVLTFDATDPHSGISSIKYIFDTSDGSINCTTGMLKVNKLTNSTCPKDVKCYCPDIGSCEMYNYSIPLNKLVHAGKSESNHKRKYFFSIKVTNNAMLSNIEHVDILVDYSPTDVDVVNEAVTHTVSTLQTNLTHGTPSSSNLKSSSTTLATISIAQHTNSPKIRPRLVKNFESVNNGEIHEDDNIASNTSNGISLQPQENETSKKTSAFEAISITTSAIAVAVGVALVLVIIYYRRRMKAINGDPKSKENGMSNINNEPGRLVENAVYDQIATDTRQSSSDENMYDQLDNAKNNDYINLRIQPVPT
ncbi:hypothetical protein ACF0H5_023190 [Mactra antiquata]